MTVTNISNQQSISLQHSPRFDELSVVLPEHIEQPTLKQLVQRIQQATLLDDSHHAKHLSDFNDNTHTKQQDIFHLVNSNSKSQQADEAQEQNPTDIKKHKNNNYLNAKYEHKKNKNRSVEIESNTNTNANANANNNSNTSLKYGEISRAHHVLNHLETTQIADASVLVLITNEDNPQLMLTRRAAHLKSHAGEVSFAGGKYEYGDGNNRVTVLREACEETALPPSKVQIVGQLPTQVSKKGLLVRPIVALVNPPVTYVPELGEIERIFWADFEKLILQETTEYILPYRNSGQTINIKTPSWHVGGKIVWGLTGRIIANLLEIAYDRTVDWYYQPADV